MSEHIKLILIGALLLGALLSGMGLLLAIAGWAFGGAGILGVILAPLVLVACWAFGYIWQNRGELMW